MWAGGASLPCEQDIKGAEEDAMTKRWKYLIGGVLGLGMIVGFVAFRPDTLFTDRKVDERLDPRVAAALAATTTTAATPTTTTPSTVPTSTPTSAPTTAAQPTVVAGGQWVGIEHETTGGVSLVADGSRSTLVLQDLVTSNGPDLVVYLSPAPAGETDSLPADALNLGPLKGNVGTQTYDIPAGVALDEFSSVVIWCDRFSVGFGVAPLTPS